MFFDPVSKEKNEWLRQIYNDLYRNGDFIENYSSIKDSLNIEYSYHLIGIQIADYISDAFNSILKATDESNYSHGIKLFYKCVYTNLRK